MISTLLLDYCRRWYVHWIIPGYAALNLLQVYVGDPDFLPMFPALTYYLYSFYFCIELFQHKTVRLYRVFPISQRELTLLLWLQGIVVPFACSAVVFSLGHLLIQLASPEPFNQWHVLPSILAPCLAVGGIAFTFLACVGWWKRALFSLTSINANGIAFKLITLAVLLLMLALISALSMSLLSFALTVAAAIAAPVIAYSQSERMLFGFIGYKGFASLRQPQARADANESNELTWFDKVQSRPHRAMALYLGFLAALISAGVFFESTISRALNKPFTILMFIVAFGVIAAAFVFSSRKLQSIRFYAALPIKRSRMIAAIIAMPAILLSPVFVLMLAVSIMHLKVYFSLCAFLLLTDAMQLRWGPKAAALSMVFGGVAVQLWLFIRYAFPDAFDWALRSHLDSLLIACLLGFSMWWIWNLLMYSSAPYRNKSGLSLC